MWVGIEIALVLYLINAQIKLSDQLYRRFKIVYDARFAYM